MLLMLKIPVILFLVCSPSVDAMGKWKEPLRHWMRQGFFGKLFSSLSPTAKYHGDQIESFNHGYNQRGNKQDFLSGMNPGLHIKPEQSIPEEMRILCLQGFYGCRNNQGYIRYTPALKWNHAYPMKQTVGKTHFMYIPYFKIPILRRANNVENVAPYNWHNSKPSMSNSEADGFVNESFGQWDNFHPSGSIDQRYEAKDNVDMSSGKDTFQQTPTLTPNEMLNTNSTAIDYHIINANIRKNAKLSYRNFSQYPVENSNVRLQGSRNNHFIFQNPLYNLYFKSRDHQNKMDLTISNNNPMKIEQVRVWENVEKKPEELIRLRNSFINFENMKTQIYEEQRMVKLDEITYNGTNHHLKQKKITDIPEQWYTSTNAHTQIYPSFYSSTLKYETKIPLTELHTTTKPIQEIMGNEAIPRENMSISSMHKENCNHFTEQTLNHVTANQQNDDDAVSSTYKEETNKFNKPVSTVIPEDLIEVSFQKQSDNFYRNIESIQSFRYAQENNSEHLSVKNSFGAISEKQDNISEYPTNQTQYTDTSINKKPVTYPLGNNISAFSTPTLLRNQTNSDVRLQHALSNVSYLPIENPLFMVPEKVGVVLENEPNHFSPPTNSNRNPPDHKNESRIFAIYQNNSTMLLLSSNANFNHRIEENAYGNASEGNPMLFKNNVSLISKTNLGLNIPNRRKW